MMKRFPEDFEIHDHWMPGATQYVLFGSNADDKECISVILGPNKEHSGIYSNGVDTYEMWDYREPDPQGHLTRNEINDHLKKFPFKMVENTGV